jgi:cyanophycinase-like exopeptidase
MKTILIVLLTFSYLNGTAQSYSSSITGDTSNFFASPEKKLCLMGGATEDDNAIDWWLQGAKGGDVVIIRVSGSLSSYNTYFTSSTFNANLNSVETILIPSVAAANHPYVTRRLREAEAIWIAGGNQNLYRTYWKNSAVDSSINWAYNTKGACIGGTSAGMMIQGQFYYYAGNNSVTSSAALANPFNSDVTLAYNDFLHIPILTNVITDTHFDNPDRKGRLMTFLARNTSTTNRPLAIACDEYTAVCIDSNGIARAFGGAPTYDDNAYFVQVNCQTPNVPEVLTANTPLTFNRSNEAVKVYKIKAGNLGNQTFNLNNWQTASGGVWENWYVQAGTLSVVNSAAANTCALSVQTNDKTNMYQLFYYDADSKMLKSAKRSLFNKIELLDVIGQVKMSVEDNQATISVEQLTSGVYFLRYAVNGNIITQKFIIE